VKEEKKKEERIGLLQSIANTILNVCGFKWWDGTIPRLAGRKVSKTVTKSDSIRCD
jgi:hypothetical protein